jgi:hypothetical protein
MVALLTVLRPVRERLRHPSAVLKLVRSDTRAGT